MPADFSSSIEKQLPVELRAYLLRRVVLGRMVFAGEVIGCAIAALGAWILLAAILDRLLGFGSDVRTAWLIISFISIAAFWFYLLRRVFDKVNWHEAAASIEPAFNQQLETLISQWLRPERASDILSAELWRNVQRQLPARSAYSFIRWRRLIVTSLAAALVIIAGIILWQIPTLGLPQLSQRLLLPGSSIAPVTTTRLTVEPGDLEVIEQSPLIIRVATERLGPTPPMIHYRTDALAFARGVMSPSDNGFIWNVPAVQKNFSYYITGGDSRTRVYHVTTLSRPTLMELRVRYNYPAYTHHDALNVTTRSGPIEAPAGTHVGLDMVALIPLDRATLQVGAKILQGSPTKLPNMRHFDLTLDHNAVAHLQLLGSNGVPGKSVTLIALNAIPDQPPLAQLLEPAADIHLTPRDLLTIGWQALDDFGVEKILLQWQINDEPPHQIPLPTSGDVRRCTGAVDLDLANMPLKIGDTLSVCVLATDGAGHQTRTTSRQIFISPRSVDIDTYLRLSALWYANDLSSVVADDLHASLAAWASANQQNQNLAAAADACALLRQAILQAVQHASETQMITAILSIGDRVAQISSTIEQVQTQTQNTDRLSRAAELAHQIKEELELIAEGEQAAIVIADRANVREMSKTTQSDPQLRLRMSETLSRAASEAERGAKDLGISPTSPDIESQLSARVHAGRAIVDAMKPVDLLAAARDWATEMRDPNHASRELAGRLEMAAGLESVRVKGDAVWARDLQLTGRAAHRIEETALHDPIVSREVMAKIVADYPVALAALFHDHEIKTQGPSAALAQMKLWAAEPDLLPTDVVVLNGPKAQDLAMEANARMAQHDYAGAAVLDAKLADTPEGRQARQNIIAAAHQMHTAARLDEVNVQAQAVAAQTAKSAEPSSLAHDQEIVAQNIEQVRRESAGAQPAPANTRDQAMAAILHAQQVLTAMPGNLANTTKYQSQVQNASALADDLNRFAPETAESVASIRHNLLPALQQLDQAVAGHNEAKVATFSKSMRNDIAQVQQALARTQEKFTQQDPLVAAKWFAKAAAVALSQQPPDLTAAHHEQTNFARAWHTAWSTAIRQASLQRLVGSETIPPSVASVADRTLHPSAKVNVGDANSEPAGYAAALQVYFRRLGEEREGQ